MVNAEQKLKPSGVNNGEPSNRECACKAPATRRPTTAGDEAALSYLNTTMKDNTVRPFHILEIAAHSVFYILYRLNAVNKRGIVAPTNITPWARLLSVLLVNPASNAFLNPKRFSPVLPLIP